jgi:hypothetical protein
MPVRLSTTLVHALAAFETILKEGQSLSKEDFFEGKSNMPVRLEVKISYLSEG